MTNTIQEYPCGHASHIGRVRSQNEDNYAAFSRQGLWVLSDGMGGRKGGKIASEIVVKTVCQAVFDGATLSEAINAAHHQILSSVHMGIGSKGMGATCTVLQINKAEFTVAWIGDSRAYFWNGQSLQQITEDHTLAQLMVNKGVLSQEQAEKHPYRHILSQVAGEQVKDMRVDTVTGQLDEKSQILLCSDGLTNAIKEIDIAHIMAENASEQIKVDRLVELALKNGGQDNITVIIVSGTPRKD